MVVLLRKIGNQECQEMHWFLVAQRESPWWLLLPFCCKIFEKWWGPKNNILLACECSLSNDYTDGMWGHSNLSCYNQFI